jgi:flagellar basal body-associated protein FliL
MSDKKAEGAPAEGEAKHGGKEEAGHGGGGGGGIKAFLPLIIMVVLMPVLAFTTTQFLILPKVIQARGDAAHGEEEHGEEAEAAGGHGAKDEGGDKSHGKEPAKDSGKDHGKAEKPKDGGKGHGAAGGGKKKQTVQITKIIVNVSGTQGSRYLMTSFTLAGTHNDFKTIVEENKDQLLDLANTAMASKTISDLEKPGARNQLRAELISIFNNALGGGLVQEIYFTEFAVQ